MLISIFKYFSTIAIFFWWINDGIMKLNAQSDTDVDSMIVATIERNIRDDVFLDCASAAAGNSVTEITWLKEYFALNFSSFRETERKAWSMKIPNLQLDDAGYYTCVMKNETSGYFHLTFDIRVYDAPEMYVKPENTTLMVGDSKNFTCKSSSKIPSYMEWYPGVNLNQVSNMMDLTPDQYNNVRTNDDDPQTLVIRNVALTDQGWYSCLARNGLNTVNASFYVEVINGKLHSPTIGKK